MTKKEKLTEQLTRLINHFSLESEFNDTPDYILANVAIAAMESFAFQSARRDDYHEFRTADYCKKRDAFLNARSPKYDVIIKDLPKNGVQLLQQYIPNYDNRDDVERANRLSCTDPNFFDIMDNLFQEALGNCIKQNAEKALIDDLKGNSIGKVITIDDTENQMWEQRRYEIAKGAAQGYASNSNEHLISSAGNANIAAWSVGIADELIRQLRGKEE